MGSYLQRLQTAIRQMHGCECLHLSTAHVHESMDGQTVWEGDVEVFRLDGHPEAKRAFGWGWKDADGETQWTVVLDVPPIDSPREAVQAAIASGQFR